MKIKQQDKKEVKPLPLTNLPVLNLTEKDMSHISGGGRTWS